MIEAKVFLPKHIAAKGHINSNKPYVFSKHLINSIPPYFFAWASVILIDVTTDNANLVWWHFISILFFAFLLSSYNYVKLEEFYKSTAREMEYDVQLDDSGVYIKNPDKHISWDNYLNYVEYEDYIQINSVGGTSFLPKTDELKEVIDFTKQKIPNKHKHSSQNTRE